jgi:hypothetical protein
MFLYLRELSLSSIAVVKVCLASHWLASASSFPERRYDGLTAQQGEVASGWVASREQIVTVLPGVMLAPPQRTRQYSG